MRLLEIRIKNYRLLIDAKLDVDAKTTLIVGRNNTAKTSCSSCINTVLQGSDFPTMIILCQREKVSTTCFCSSWRKS